MNIRKFYDSDQQEASAGSEPISIAAMMAKQGTMSHDNSPVIPQVREQREETTRQEPIPVETTIEAKVENEESQVFILPEDTTQVQPQWQEVLRHQQPEDVLKELGFNENAVGFLKELKDVDPKMLQFFNTWKSEGGVKDYLKEMTMDYAQLPSEDVMRHQLREEYPKATERQLDVLYKKEIVEKYNLDSMDDDLVEEGKLMLDAKAEMYRDRLVQKQQEYLLPKYVPNNAPNEAEIKSQQEFESYKNALIENQLTRDMVQNGRLQIGEGDEKFNFPLANPNNIVNNLFDSNAWASKLFDIRTDANGNEQFVPNVEKQLLVSAILEDHKGFIKEISKHYKSLGGKATIDSLDNPSPIGNASQPVKPVSEPKTPAEWMARGGRLV